MGTLQDALRKAGLADERKPDRERRRNASGAASARPAKNSRRTTKSGARTGPAGTAGNPANAGRKPRSQSDLARAYAARRRAEEAEKEAVKQRRVAEQEARRKRNLELDEIIRGNTLNRKEAELPRYFEHMGRIRRVLCTPEQREQLNSGQIGVVNLRGSYLLVSPDTLEKYRQTAPDLVPELAGRTEPDDDGSHYPPVPDDLVW